MPSRLRSPTPANTERPPCTWAMLLISSRISTVLPTPAPPKSPTLPPFTYGARRSTTLIPVSKISVVGLRAVERRRLAVDRPALALLDRVALVDRLAEHVEDPPERPLADRHRDRAAGVDHVEAAGQAVGRVHRDRPHPAVAQVLLHLRHEPPAVGQRDLERVVDRGQAAREDGVDDDTFDLDDPADVRGLAVLGQCDSLCGGRGTGNPAPGAGSYHSGTSTGSDFVTRRGRHGQRLFGRASPTSASRRERSSAAATRAAWSRCQTRDETAEIIGMPVR